MIHRLLDLETVVLDRGGALLKELATLASRPAPFRPSLRQDLLLLSAHIERLLTATEKESAKLTPEDAEVALGSLDRVFHTWIDLNYALRRVETLAALGKLDEGFSGLAAAAAGENLEERLGLAPLRDTLRQIARTPRAPRNGHPAALASAPTPDPYPAYLDAPPDLIDSAVLSELEPPRPPQAHSAPGLDYVFPLGTTEPEPAAAFEKRLDDLASDDDLESESALVELLDRHRESLVLWLFKSFAEKKPGLAPTLAVLWRHADVVLLSDYFSAGGEMKLFQLLANTGPHREAELFQKLVSLFRLRADSQPNSADLSSLDRDADTRDRDVILRSLLLHPRSAYRRYAISQLAPSEFWSLVSFPRVPLVPLVDVLDRLALEDVSNDYRKAFFDCTLGTLESARSELELRAARRIMHRLVNFDFFIEDRYYEKLQKLNETLAAEEARVGLESWLIERSMALLKERKERSSPRAARPPKSLLEIPLAVQRKLARQGIYLPLFIRHTDPRIALETLRFIDSPPKAEAVLKVPTVNREVIARLAERDELLVSYGARLALVSHPRVPIAAAQKVAPALKAEDLDRLLTLRDVSPEVRKLVREHLARLRSVAESHS